MMKKRLRLWLAIMFIMTAATQSHSLRSPQVQPKSDSEAQCLAQAIYFEAGHESQLGKLAVGQVIMNRYHAHFASTICGVVNQHSGKTYQFAFAGQHRTVAQPTLFKKCLDVAKIFLNNPINQFVDMPSNTLYFNMKHGVHFNPRHYDLVCIIGNQCFYRKIHG